MNFTYIHMEGRFIRDVIGFKSENLIAKLDAVRRDVFLNVFPQSDFREILNFMIYCGRSVSILDGC